MGWLRKSVKKVGRAVKKGWKRMMIYSPGYRFLQNMGRSVKNILNPDIPPINLEQNPLPAPTAPEESLDLSLNPNARRSKVNRSSLKISRSSSAPRTSIGINMPR